MNAIQFKARGGAEALVFGSVEMPRPPREGEIIVRVNAAGVTPTELLWQPTWTTPTGMPRAFPIIPGHEFSGDVYAVGPGVAELSVGDAVYGMNDWFANGTQAEFCIALASSVAKKPRSIDHATASIVPISALTAWQGLVERARLASGECVLVHGAAGGVGLFAVQVARSRGAKVFATASAHNSEFVRGIGADTVIDYHTQRFEDVLSANAGGVDVVFDTVGGETLSRSWAVLRPGGRMVTVAASAEDAREPRVKDAFFVVEPNREQLARVAKMIDAGELNPVLDSVFSLPDARRAYERKPVRGKVVVQVVA